jgi:hypothetical protein
VDLATVEPALSTLVARATGITAALVQWENAPRVQHTGSLALLSWVSETSIGHDETRWAYTDVGNGNPLTEMTPTVRQRVRAVLQVSVEVHDQRPGQSASAIAQRIPARLRAPSFVAEIAAMGLGLAAVGDVRRADYDVDDRFVSRALVELTLNAHTTFVDTDGRNASIAQVEIDATVLSAGGTTLPATLAGDTIDGPT